MASRSLRLFALAILSGLFWTGNAHKADATLITFYFEADVVAVGAGLAPVTTSDTLSGFVTYDTSAPFIDVGGLGEFGIYTGAVTNVSIGIGALGLAWTSSGTGDASVLNDRFLPAAGEVVDRFSTGDVPISGSPLGLFAPLNFALTLLDLDETVYNSLALPTFFDLSEFEGRVAVTTFADSGGAEQVIDARITFLQVPEPGVLSLFLLGLLGLAALATRGRAASHAPA